MPRRIEPSRAALADFDALYDLIARDNPSAAAQVLRTLDRSIQLLADQPKLERVFRHRRHRLRLLTHGEYLVFYRVRPGVIELVRVIHARRNLPDFLDDLSRPRQRARIGPEYYVTRKCTGPRTGLQLTQLGHGNSISFLDALFEVFSKGFSRTRSNST